MPLVRPLDDPSFDTIGEVIDFMGQIFEVRDVFRHSLTLVFTSLNIGHVLSARTPHRSPVRNHGQKTPHETNIFIRDGNANNIMMDPTAMYPDMYHPAEIDRTYDYKGKAFHYTRTQRPPKYYIIDFGISCRYLPEQLPVMEYVILGGDKSPPEHQNDAEQADPFPTDVYFLSNMIRTNFIEVRSSTAIHYHDSQCSQPKRGFQFIEPLVNDMTQTDPTKRPTMADVVTRFAKIRASLSAWKLRSRVALRNEFFMATPFRAIPHWKRRLGYMFSGTHAIPTAK
jgi:serine/threonine protein kinase